MTQLENSFLINLLKILPEEVDCFIQAPSLDNEVIQAMFQKTKFDYFNLICLNEISKGKFLEQELKTSFSIYIQNIEIMKNGHLLFKGYDGVEYGIISKEIPIPKWFKEKYIPDTCLISSEW